MANIMLDNAHWDNWLIGTWNSTDQMYEISGPQLGLAGGAYTTYGGTINPGDTLTFDLISFGGSSFSSVAIYVNGVSGTSYDTTTAGEVDGISISVNPGDIVQIRGDTGCCVYDFNVNIRPSAPPGAFWTDFRGCHES